MPSPLAHQLGFMYGIVMSVMLGGTAVLQGVFAAEEMARQIRDEGATFTVPRRLPGRLARPFP